MLVPNSLVSGIFLGEYVLGLVPPGTHDWDKFITPEELNLAFERNNLEKVSLRGLRYNPWIPPYWSFTNITSVNYIASYRHKK